ncbi:formylglycine-generating enzyme family protein, partial [Thermodesulfobacteriota bacterium]
VRITKLRFPHLGLFAGRPDGGFSVNIIINPDSIDIDTDAHKWDSEYEYGVISEYKKETGPSSKAEVDEIQAYMEQEIGLDIEEGGVWISPHGIKMVRIPAGNFIMGSDEDEQGRDKDEGPPRRVTISRDFLMSVTEVTRGQWKKVIENIPKKGEKCGDKCPVVNVNWFDAVAYCNALSDLEGLEECYTLHRCKGVPGKDMKCYYVTFKDLDCEGYRLSTETEWEYACRAGTTTPYYTGSTKTDLYRIACVWGSDGGPYPVATLEPNAWGLYDMLGNVSEWCWDWYGRRAYLHTPTVDSLGVPKGTSRVIRGGSHLNSARNCRAAKRYNFMGSLTLIDTGFRLVRSLP